MTCSKIYIATTTAHFTYEGKRVLVKQGVTTVHEDHGLYRAHPELFAPQRVDWDVEHQHSPAPVVETATAEPGAQRRVGRPPLPRDDEGNIIRPDAKAGPARPAVPLPAPVQASDDKEGEAS